MARRDSWDALEILCDQQCSVPYTQDEAVDVDDDDFDSEIIGKELWYFFCYPQFLVRRRKTGYSFSPEIPYSVFCILSVTLGK